MEQLLAAAGAIILGGGGLSLIAFGIFKWLGEKWLTSKFEEKLAAYKHAQQKELEQLRFRINSLMDRTTKLHQREFDIVPEAWSLLVEAHNTVLSLVASLQQYPDVNRMNASQLDEFVKDSFLTEWQKNELKLAPDKLKYYQKALFWHRLGKGKAACRDEHVHLLKNGIFMSDDLEVKFKKVEDLIWDALVEHEINESEEVRPRLKAARDALTKEGTPLMDALKKEIKDRLWSVQLITS